MKTNRNRIGNEFMMSLWFTILFSLLHKDLSWSGFASNKNNNHNGRQSGCISHSWRCRSAGLHQVQARHGSEFWAASRLPLILSALLAPWPCKPYCDTGFYSLFRTFFIYAYIYSLTGYKLISPVSPFIFKDSYFTFS